VEFKKRLNTKRLFDVEQSAEKLIACPNPVASLRRRPRTAPLSIGRLYQKQEQRRRRQQQQQMMT
jgi:hypothetical protein